MNVRRYTLLTTIGTLILLVWLNITSNDGDKVFSLRQSFGITASDDEDNVLYSESIAPWGDASFQNREM